jgi:hypothetical protein
MQTEALIFHGGATLPKPQELHPRGLDETLVAKGFTWHRTREEDRRFPGTTGGMNRVARQTGEIAF